MKKGFNKKETTVILVGKSNQVLAPTGTLNTTGTSFNIADGQLGVVSMDFNGTVAHDSFVTAGVTANQVNAIKVVQGTPASAALYNTDLFEVGDRALVDSGIIYKDSIKSFTALKLRSPRYSAYSPAGLLPASVKSNTTYKAYFTIDSVRNDRDWSDNQEVVPVTVTTKDVSGITSGNRLDYLINLFAYKANMFSKITRTVAGNGAAKNRPFVVFGVNTAGGSGQAIGTITCGTVINYLTDRNTLTTSTVTSSITANTPLVRALAEVVAKSATLVPASTIEVIDLSTAGAAANIDTFIVVGLEHTLGAYFDDVEQSLVRVDVSLGDNWGTVTPTLVRQDEGTGQGVKWTIDNENRAQLQVHTMQKHPFMEYFSQGKTYINPLANYTSYILEYFDVEDPLGLSVYSPKKLVILLPAALTCVTVTAGETNYNAGNPVIPSATSDSATVTSLNAILGAWLESARPYSNHSVGGSATTGTYFV